MEMGVQKLIQALNLQPHPEGGFYTETFRDDSVKLLTSSLPSHCKHHLRPAPSLRCVVAISKMFEFASEKVHHSRLLSWFQFTIINAEMYHELVPLENQRTSWALNFFPYERRSACFTLLRIGQLLAFLCSNNLEVLRGRKGFVSEV